MNNKPYQPPPKPKCLHCQDKRRIWEAGNKKYPCPKCFYPKYKQ